MVYECLRGHKTAVKKKYSAIRCRFHYGDEGSTHYPGCDEYHTCTLWAYPVKGK